MEWGTPWQWVIAALTVAGTLTRFLWRRRAMPNANERRSAYRSVLRWAAGPFQRDYIMQLLGVDATGERAMEHTTKRLADLLLIESKWHALQNEPSGDVSPGASSSD